MAVRKKVGFKKLVGIMQGIGRIRIDKPTDDGVVVTALQVIETGFGIVVIAAIAEGVDLADIKAGLAPSNIAVAPRIEVYSFLPVVSRVGGSRKQAKSTRLLGCFPYGVLGASHSNGVFE